MSEISESDRFECVVVNVIENLDWKGVIVEEIKSSGRLYFARVTDAENEINVGDTLYIGAKPITFDLEDKEMEVSLYNTNNEKIDWTLI